MNNSLKTSQLSRKHDQSFTEASSRIRLSPFKFKQVSETNDSLCQGSPFGLWDTPNPKDFSKIVRIAGNKSEVIK
jgi:hypothetical protein